MIEIAARLYNGRVEDEENHYTKVPPLTRADLTRPLAQTRPDPSGLSLMSQCATSTKNCRMRLRRPEFCFPHLALSCRLICHQLTAFCALTSCISAFLILRERKERRFLHMQLAKICLCNLPQGKINSNPPGNTITRPQIPSRYVEQKSMCSVSALRYIP